MSRVDEKAAELTEALQAELGDIEVKANAYTLADAIRQGSSVTDHAVGSYGTGATACVLTAALVAARAHGLA